MKNLYLFLLLICGHVLLAQNESAMDVYTNDIVRAALGERIQLLDSQLVVIGCDRLDEQFVIRDTVINDSWTRPQYVDNVFRKGFDGVVVDRIYCLDTVTYVDTSFIAFWETKSDNEGNFISKDRVFLLDRRVAEVSADSVRKRRIQSMDSVEQILAHRLVTQPNESWRNMNSSNFCDRKYRLVLDVTGGFEQSYEGRSYCFLDSLDSQIKTGVEADNFEEYAQKEQGYKISYQNGYWMVKGRELVFFSLEGLVFLRLKVITVLDGFVEMEADGSRILLVRGD